MNSWGHNFLKYFPYNGSGLANSITTLGGSINETEIVKKMLQVVPDHLEQVAISIEILLDVNDLTVEEVTGRLRNVEQRKKNTASAVDKEGRLLLMEESKSRSQSRHCLT